MLCCSLTFFEMYDFHLSLLDLNIFHFYQENFDWFSVVLWKRFDFWSLELDIRNFKIEIWIFEIWDFGLKLEIWNLVTWALKLDILKICDLKFWTWNLKFEILGILNLKNWAFRMWNFKLGHLRFGIWKKKKKKKKKKKTWNLKFELEVLSLIGSKRFVIPFLSFFFWKFILLLSWCDFFRSEKEKEMKRKEKGFFFLGADWVSWFLCGGRILAPHFLCLFLCCFFLLHLFFHHQHYSLSSSPWFFFFLSPFLLKKKHFSKLLKFPLSISLNISLDPCVLEHFFHTPIFGETHFQNHFSLHQNVFFF